MNYGIPYKGSKSKIAEWVVDNLPTANHFYDLFAGGCAITHCAMRNNKYAQYHVNDTEKSPQLFCDAAAGKYKQESRWISHDDFFNLKSKDPYVKFIWSFGNDGKTYMYSKAIEQEKQRLWESCFVNGLYSHEKRTKLEGRVVSLERLERINALAEEGLYSSNVQVTNKSYQDVEILHDSAVYCDIPYAGTNKYSTKFSHADFYQWARTRDFPVYISEYNMPDDFVSIASIGRRCKMNAAKSRLTTEHIFVHERFSKILRYHT